MPEEIRIRSQSATSRGLKHLIEGFKIRPLHLLLGTALSILFLWLAFRQVPLESLSVALQDLNWPLLALSTLMSLLGSLLRAERWRLLYYPDHHTVSFFKLLGLLFISQMLNLLIPARVGELARISFLDQQPPGRTLGTVAVEKLLDLLTLLAFLLALPFAVALPTWFQTSRRSFLILALSAFGLSVLLFFMKDRLVGWLGQLMQLLPPKWGGRLHKALTQALAGLEVFRSTRVGLGLQAWSFAIWGWGALVNFVLFKAFGFDLSLTAAVFLLLVLQVGISIPTIPGKLGIFQVVTILALSVFGIGKELALPYSLVLYLVGFGPHIVFGTIFGIREGANKLVARRS